MDADERLALLDRQGLDAAVLYPTLSILWEAELDDVELSQAYTRAYNRWITDFCRSSRGRLVPIAHLSLGDPHAAARELQRAVADGARGAFVAPFTLTRKPHGHPDHDPVFAVAQDLDVPIAIHPTFEPTWANSQRFTDVRRARLFLSVTASDGVRHAFTTLFDFGVFDRFPRLKIVVLESGAGWIGYWLDRLDAVYEATFSASTCRSRRSRVNTSGASVGSRVTPTNGRSRRSPTSTARSASSGPPTSPTRTTRATISKRSKRWRSGWARRHAGACSAGTFARRTACMRAADPSPILELRVDLDVPASPTASSAVAATRTRASHETSGRSEGTL
jgi:predicted TIM-barrel fold metal-dependent hydrolase